MNRIRVVSAVSICLIISACGFSLRGNDVLTAKFNSLHLDLQQPNSEFSQLLRRNLEIASVASPAANGLSTQTNIPVLHITAEQLVSRPVSVNPRARAAQYELRVSIDATLSRGVEILMGPETLLVERSYFEDIENIAGNQEEIEIITNEMRRELVNQLIRRLEAIEM